MTLLIALIAAVVVTVIWYACEKARRLKVGLMCYMYWGASLMWLVDAVFEYAQSPSEFFNPAAADMVNDIFLGISAVTLGAVVWLAVLLIKDPNEVIAKALTKENL